MTAWESMRKHLSEIGITKNISGDATVNGYPAIVLYNNGDEHYYTGFDMPGEMLEQPHELEYRENVVARFGDEAAT